MAGQLSLRRRLRRAAGPAATAAAVIIPVTLAGSSVFGTFTVDLDRREGLADLSRRKALVESLQQPAGVTTDALLAKPLFLAARQPFRVEVQSAPAPAPAPIQVMPAPTYRIGGVMISPETRKVLLRGPDSPTGQWLAEGDITAQGWMVSSIAENKVSLARDRQSAVFDLYASR